METGTKVGARRWPYAACHPDCWGRPWAGKTLAVDDPKAWAQSLAFPTAKPKRAEVKAHVERCRAQGLLQDKTPVLWDFGDKTRVYWEDTSSLRAYAQDLKEWEEAHAREMQRLGVS